MRWVEYKVDRCIFSLDDLTDDNVVTNEIDVELIKVYRLIYGKVLNRK